MLCSAPSGVDPELKRACFDSRAVRSGDLYCALPGARAHGRSFLAEAMTRGAAAVLTAPPLDECELPTLCASDAAELSWLAGESAHLLAGEPSTALWCAAVTGTNGKTTTVHLLAQALEACRLPCARAGTLGFSFGGRSVSTRETTVSADRLHAWLSDAAAAGARACALEASSHGISQGRLAGVRLGAAAWTNLTHDHLDYHGTLEEYAAAKAALFHLLPIEALALIPARCEPAVRLTRATRARRLLWTMNEAAGELRARAECRDGGVFMEIDGEFGSARLQSPLAGLHNAENLLLAWGLARAAGADGGAAAEALEKSCSAPGRLERVLPDAPWSLFVDYAHTPDALERVIEALRASHPGVRLGVVFGAGGDRDPHKRAPMGRAVAGAADWCVITSDNPRSEDPAQIAEAVAVGVRAAGVEAEIVLDRRTAIRAALARCGAGEILLIAGKGHEDYQEICGVRHPFDDRVELE
ncbi:MAG: UDP-N-acetylmuramoyl-L-alanyl-D-glutamate--2,6-diaminopimelate ligase, partial [Planctomycetota bacterium]|nr:UDP-N-acetylmuramoyl-L-alanyl-D-glutamate--2,6-diaminopimelate ligase [Planctomycetota bacterium]